MSDETTGVAVEAPPVEAPAVEAPAAEIIIEEPGAELSTEIEREEGKGRPGARRNARKRAEQLAQKAEADSVKAEAAREKALGQPRKEAGVPEGGQFAKGDGAESAVPSEAVASAPADAPAAEVAGADSPVEQSGAQVPDGWVDIPLPDGHPLRERGRTSVRATKDQEDDVRNGINAAVRLRQVQAERDELARTNALLEARREALSGDLPSPETDPRYQALVEQIRAAPGFGDELAETVLEGLKARQELRVINAEREADQGVQMRRTAHEIAAEIESRAAQVFGVWAESGELARRTPDLIRQYYRAVDTVNQRDGTNRMPTADEFLTWAGPAYKADPRVQAKITTIQKQEQERIRAQIRAEERAALEKEVNAKATDAANRHASRPPTSRAMPPSSIPATEAAPEERAPPRPGNLRRDAKARIRERLAGR